ncbi:proline-rich protein 18-like [Orcinus orca]|uniref:proline-rich protein 18-like n=1 Tax=Orcinus orca TaxID=9733 RepID=UPI002111A208|nr:proline-rich protein 18-like [Orcinus orca]
MPPPSPSICRKRLDYDWVPNPILAVEEGFQYEARSAEGPLWEPPRGDPTAPQGGAARWRQGDEDARVPSRPRAVGAAAPDLDALPRPPRAGLGAATGSSLTPGASAVTSVPRLCRAQSPGFLQPRKTSGGRHCPERGRQRRRAGGQLQAKPGAPAGASPFNPALDTELREEDLLQRELNARAPPRGRQLPQPHPPATTAASAATARNWGGGGEIQLGFQEHGFWHL